LNETDTPFWSILDLQSKLYFNNNLIINKGGLWNANIKALLLYKRLLDISERSSIISYIKWEHDNDKSLSLEDYIFQKCTPISEAGKIEKYSLYTNSSTETLVMPNRVIDLSTTLQNTSYNGSKKFSKDTAPSFKSQADNYNPSDAGIDNELVLSLNLGKSTDGEPGAPIIKGSPNNNMCLDTCITSCSSTNNIRNDTYDFLSCINGCKFKYNSCKEYCKGNKGYVCDDISLDNVKIVDSCPNIFVKDGSYNVNVPSTSFYGKLYKDSNLQTNYGTDRQVAKQIYTRNYPKCIIPMTLQDTATSSKSCPYAIYEGNPCNSSSCKGVDWSKSDYATTNLSANCKYDINNYCNKNYSIDPNCSAWKPENKDVPKAQLHRGQFANQCDETCQPGNHPIEAHPNFAGYIKKDNIPCWNCNLK
jgi:hypothetical protein